MSSSPTQCKRETLPASPTVDYRPIPRGRLSVTRAFLSASEVRALRADARALHAGGLFAAAALGGRTASTTTNAQRRLCDACGLFDDGVAAAAARGVGDAAARESLFARMAGLREQLQRRLGRPLATRMELQYLRYPAGGGFYRRHLDHEAGDDDAVDLRRSVSLLLYLNGPGWDARRDGGVLRAYPQGAKTQEVAPDGGTLVLFDSRSVEHEVLPTRAERWALVGWFMAEGGGSGGGGAGGKKRRRGRDGGGRSAGSGLSASAGARTHAAGAKRAKTAQGAGGSRAAKRRAKQRQK